MDTMETYNMETYNNDMREFIKILKHFDLLDKLLALAYDPQDFINHPSIKAFKLVTKYMCNFILNETYNEIPVANFVDDMRQSCKRELDIGLRNGEYTDYEYNLILGEIIRILLYLKNNRNKICGGNKPC